VLAPVSSTQVKPKPKPATLAVPVAAADKKSPPPHVKALKAAELARAHQLQREQVLFLFENSYLMANFLFLLALKFNDSTGSQTTSIGNAAPR
jgi:hypothetical protein